MSAAIEGVRHGQVWDQEGWRFAPSAISHDLSHHARPEPTPDPEAECKKKRHPPDRSSPQMCSRQFACKSIRCHIRTCPHAHWDAQ